MGRIDSRKIWKTALLAVLLGFGTWLVLRAFGPASLPPDFPVRPDLESANPALVELIGGADEQARSHPDSAADAGRLGKVYHANQFYDEAQRAYAIASRLDSQDYRWVYYQALVAEERGQERVQSSLLQRVLELKPDCLPALHKQADILMKQGHLQEAGLRHKPASGWPALPRGAATGPR